MQHGSKAIEAFVLQAWYVLCVLLQSHSDTELCKGGEWGDGARGVDMKFVAASLLNPRIPSVLTVYVSWPTWRHQALVFKTGSRRPIRCTEVMEQVRLQRCFRDLQPGFLDWSGKFAGPFGVIAIRIHLTLPAVTGAAQERRGYGSITRSWWKWG